MSLFESRTAPSSRSFASMSPQPSRPSCRGKETKPKPKVPSSSTVKRNAMLAKLLPLFCESGRFEGELQRNSSVSASSSSSSLLSQPTGVDDDDDEGEADAEKGTGLHNDREYRASQKALFEVG